MTDHDIIQQLEKNGLYQVIEKLQAPDVYHQSRPQTPRLGIVLDTETTGLDTKKDKIIELGFIAFEYDAGSGSIHRILHRFVGFEDPQEALSDIVKQLTGIHDDMLTGQTLDEKNIMVWLGKADLIIAHNAGFDRPMLERRFPQVSDKNWACTLNDINWQDENIASLKLDYIAYKLGYFFEGHRAVNDAEATLHMLSKTLPKSAKSAMMELLIHARKKSRRYFAVDAPFDKKDELKDNGYRWLADYAYTDKYGKPKKGVWSKSIPELDIEHEEAWLIERIYNGQATQFIYNDITANHRYSIQEFQ
ncbi:MAG: 3'-5' exonuclease [Ghiorsea sp.]|nr:3'-5' exonuclease [Ghiorsea sp.]